MRARSAVNGIAGVAIALVVFVAGPASLASPAGSDPVGNGGNAVLFVADYPVADAVTVPADHRDRDRSARGVKDDGKDRSRHDKDDYDKDEYDKDRKHRHHDDKEGEANDPWCIAEDEAVIGPVCIEVEDVIADILTVD